MPRADARIPVGRFEMPRGPHHAPMSPLAADLSVHKAEECLTTVTLQPSRLSRCSSMALHNSGCPTDVFRHSTLVPSGATGAEADSGAGACSSRHTIHARALRW